MCPGVSQFPSSSLRLIIHAAHDIDARLARYGQRTTMWCLILPCALKHSRYNSSTVQSSPCFPLGRVGRHHGVTLRVVRLSPTSTTLNEAEFPVSSSESMKYGGT